MFFLSDLVAEGLFCRYSMDSKLGSKLSIQVYECHVPFKKCIFKSTAKKIFISRCCFSANLCEVKSSRTLKVILGSAGLLVF